MPRHRPLSELEPHLPELAASPKDHGVLAMVVCRPAKGQRRILEAGVLDEASGLLGDSWATRPDEPPHPLKQVTLMNARMARLLSHLPEEQALAGDQLYVDLDLSIENLPTGTRLAVGTAVVEVTAPPHRGCGIFVRHFGAEACRFVNGHDGRPLRLRGVNARVVRGGRVRPGDELAVHRPSTLF